MEVCGTHTMAIARSGLRSMLPENVELISGPGCPVCVTSQGEIDLFFELLDKGISVASFGDLLRIPGSNGETLIDKRARGADVNVVYSPLDTLKLAEENPDKHYTFLGIGFETTAPTVAALIMAAKEKGLKNLSVLSFCKTMPAAFDLILSDKELHLDGFLCPGHVTAVTGVQLYEPLIKAGKAAVVAGFEPVEMLDAVYEIVKQSNNQDFHIVNKYRRVVPDEGNAQARAILAKVFDESDAVWRGLGELKKSGLAIKDEYIEYEGAYPTPSAIVNDHQRNWSMNVDVTNDPQEIAWSYFLTDTRYQNEGIGIFEGANYYPYGIYRATENSIMRYNTGGFNAPSRQSIYRRIMEKSGGVYSFENFLEYDEINRQRMASPSFSRAGAVKKGRVGLPPIRCDYPSSEAKYRLNQQKVNVPFR